MITLYKIYFGDNDLAKHETVKKIVQDVLHAATIYETIGLWNKQSESGLVIDVILDDSEAEKIFSLCEKIKQETKQQAVVFTEQQVKFYCI